MYFIMFIMIFLVIMVNYSVSYIIMVMWLAKGLLGNKVFSQRQNVIWNTAYWIFNGLDLTIQCNPVIFDHTMNHLWYLLILSWPLNIIQRQRYWANRKYHIRLGIWLVYEMQLQLNYLDLIIQGHMLYKPFWNLRWPFINTNKIWQQY